MESENISQVKIITIAINLLHNVFMEMHEDFSGAYNDIYGGKQLYLTTVVMEDGSQLPFHLELDHTHYNGELNFAAFDAGVRLLIANLVEALRDKEITVHEAERYGRMRILGVTALIQSGDTFNALVLGCGSAQTPGLLRLIYLGEGEYT